MSIVIQKTNMFRRLNTKLCILVLVLIAALSGYPLVSSAQSVTAYDLIAAVNALRVSQGLEPYQIDPWLMDYAQEHSEYQASIQTGTHLHSDGTLPQEIGLQENVASVDEEVATADVVVNRIWVDWGHRNTMIGYSTGSIGAGAALSSNGQIYFTIDVRPGDDDAIVTPYPASSGTVIAETGTPIPVLPLETVIPSEDGSITHIVGYGQTLWSIAIAYGVTVDDIRRLNGIAGDSTVIYVGQKLLIRPAYAVTPTMSGETSDIPAETSTRSLKENPASTVTPSSFAAAVLSTTSITITPSPFLTSSPTNPAIVPSTVLSSNKVVVIVVLLFIAVLLPLVILSFRESGRRKIPREQK